MADLTIRDWMVIAGALLILAVLVDAWRRVYQERRAVRPFDPVEADQIGDSEADGEGDKDDDIGWFKELPNGGARVVPRDGRAETGTAPGAGGRPLTGGGDSRSGETAGPVNPQPAAPEPAAPKPATTQPATARSAATGSASSGQPAARQAAEQSGASPAQPAAGEPVAPGQPASRQAAATPPEPGKPATPRTAAPGPVAPQPATPRPAAPGPAAPGPAAAKAAAKAGKPLQAGAPSKSPSQPTPKRPATPQDEVELLAGFNASDDADNLDWLDALDKEQEQKKARREPRASTGKAQLPRDVQPEVFMLNVVARNPGGFRGEDILHILLACDLRFGDMNFFHRHEYEAGRGPIQFSVANMMQPGVFDIDNMADFTTTGLVFFLTLPGPEDMMKAFNYMLETAQVVARNLGGDVLDETRSVLTRQTLEHSRQQIRDLERRLLAKTR